MFSVVGRMRFWVSLEWLSTVDRAWDQNQEMGSYSKPVSNSSTALANLSLSLTPECGGSDRHFQRGSLEFTCVCEDSQPDSCTPGEHFIL